MSDHESFRPRAAVVVAGLVLAAGLGVALSRVHAMNSAFAMEKLVWLVGVLAAAPPLVALGAFLAFKRSNVAGTIAYAVAVAGLSAASFLAVFKEKERADAAMTAQEQAMEPLDDGSTNEEFDRRLREGRQEREQRIAEIEQTMSAKRQQHADLQSQTLENAWANSLARLAMSTPMGPDVNTLVKAANDAFERRRRESRENDRKHISAFYDAGGTRAEGLTSIEAIDQRLLLLHQARAARTRQFEFDSRQSELYQEELTRHQVPPEVRTRILTAFNQKIDDAKKHAANWRVLYECASTELAESSAILQVLKDHFGKWKFEDNVIKLQDPAALRRLEKSMRARNEASERADAIRAEMTEAAETAK